MEMNTYCAKCRKKGPVVDVKVGNEYNPVQVSMQVCYDCFEENFSIDADDSVYYLDDYEDEDEDDKTDNLDDETDNLDDKTDDFDDKTDDFDDKTDDFDDKTDDFDDEFNNTFASN